MRKYRVIAVVLCLLLTLTGCGKPDDSAIGTMPASSDTGQPVQTDSPSQETPSAEVKDICSLTGLPIEKGQNDLRPIAVMIDNMASARPQSGLIDADIVYEMPAEGGITRYLAVYHHQDSEKIGPVRSARSYFIDKSMEYNAVFVHCGGSPEALKDIQTLKIDSFNELKGERNFWRSKDRKPPHNLYTSTKLIREVMDAKNLSQEKWSFKFDFSQEFIDLDGKKINGMVIDYKHNYKADYEYDEAQKLFYRAINGVRLKDKESGAEVSAVNIIVERVKSKIVDDVGRLDLNNVGNGRGYLITGGKLIEIQWSKKDRHSKTVYTDLKGNPIKLNKGNTWVQVVPDYATIDIKE